MRMDFVIKGQVERVKKASFIDKEKEATRALELVGALFTDLVNRVEALEANTGSTDASLDNHEKSLKIIEDRLNG